MTIPTQKLKDHSTSLRDELLSKRPATPLPWKRSPWIRAHGHAVYTNIASGPSKIACVSVHGKFRDSDKPLATRTKNGDYNGLLLESNCNRDAAYLCHAANSYPLLVEALQNIEANLTGKDCRAERVADSLRRATEILRELGESE
jgi:hypothetical protein